MTDFDGEIYFADDELMRALRIDAGLDPDDYDAGGDD